MSDPELRRLLVEELTRHEPMGGDATLTKRALHALKGSASLAGERELADALARLERRISEGDATAIAAAQELVSGARAALAEGRRAPVAVWPEPPRDLSARAVAPHHAHYAAEMRDRIERLDAALEGGGRAAVAAAFREVHAMKGAALAVSDEPTAWFCHGLEARLRAGEQSEEDASQVLVELGQHRFILAELLVAPERALESLRSVAQPLTTLPPETPPRSRTDDEIARSANSEDTLRVATARLDRLLERIRQIGQMRGQVTTGARLVQNLSTRARQLRLTLAEALRLIGPPRPWGTPAAAISRLEETAAALAGFAEQLEEESLVLKETADRMLRESGAAHGELAEIRTTRAGWLFDRVAAAALADARRRGAEVRFTFTGVDTQLDRRVAEQLFDPVLQLARNAVVHGVEPAAERAMRGKPHAFGVELSAARRSGGLRIAVSDDGAGVDVADVRARAIARGLIAPATARAADDETLLALLFVPGFTTREEADLLAGRGVGLDLALEAVQRLGGTIRLASSRGAGVVATIDVPFEPGLVRIIWIEAGGATYALPVEQARRVLLASDPHARGARSLASILDPASSEAEAPPIVIELEPANPKAEPGLFSVDAVGVVEEVALRAVSPLVRTAGPFAAAVVRGDELRLCLDAAALAEML